MSPNVNWMSTSKLTLKSIEVLAKALMMKCLRYLGDQAENLSEVCLDIVEIS